MKKNVLIILLMFISVTLFAKEKMDFELYNLQNSAQGREHFKEISTQFVNVISPKFIGEAETRGVDGFEIGLGYSMTAIQSTGDAWSRATNDEYDEIHQFYNGLDIFMKKGLPFGFSVYGNVRYLLFSEMVSGGIGAEFTLNEGYKYYPELSIGGGYNALYSASDMNMDMWEIRAKLSKTFPIGGEVRISPSFAYSHLFASASSVKLGGFYQENAESFQFEEIDLSIDRIALGFKFQRGRFALNLEGILPFESHSSYNLNSGISFIF